MAQTSHYWSRRTSRRATLRGGALLGGAGLSAAFLAACGGDKNESSSSGSGSSGARETLITSTAEAATTKQPKPGGSLSFQLSSPPPTLDPYTQTSFVSNGLFGLSYSKLLRFKAGVPEIAPGDNSMEPDLATAMPEQAEPTQLTFKLKPAKFQNGRALTAEDVKYAFDRYITFDKSVYRPQWAFIDRVEAPDPQTVTIRTKFPYADAQYLIGGSIGAWISPKEIAESPDAASKMMGSGPFTLTEYQTGTSLTWKKNPDYFEKPYPYVDEVKGFITTDQAKRVADFSAKSVDLTWLFLPEERDQLKKNRPDAKLEETQGISAYIYMRTDKPPFNDKRVRQALSLGINRKAIRDALTKGEGQNDQAMWVGLAGWSRPVKDLGPASQYWEYNPQQAKQLLQAAGVTSINATWDHADAAIYTQQYVDLATLTQAQWKEIGVTIQDRPAPYAQYISTTYQGQYEQIGHSPRAAQYYVDSLSDRFYWGPGGRARINLSYVNDPRLNDLLDKQRSQFNDTERKATVRQLEDLIAEEQWEIYYSTDTRTYFWNPQVINYRPSSFFPQTHYMKLWKE
jgi:ABC-type transport system substrate-binding protein